MSNPHPVYRTPPVEGRWKPGQSGNPAGGRKHKAYREALERNLALLGKGDAQATLNRIAAAHITRCEQGDIGAIKEFADRMDGKIPQALVGSDEDPAIAVTSIVRTIVDVSVDTHALPIINEVAQVLDPIDISQTLPVMTENVPRCSLCGGTNCTGCEDAR